MKKYLVSMMALLALTGLVLLAADIDGTWTAETQGKNGPQTQTLTLMSKGDALTGKMDNGGKGGPADISDGKIEGNNVSFKIVRDFGGKQVSQEFKGTLAGGELKGQMTGGRGPVDMTFKKK
jgi:hypothetical protein